MKFIVVLLCTIPELLLAQPRWTRIKLGEFIRVQRVTFVDTSVGYVLCSEINYPYKAVLYRTSDGGSSWSKIYVDTSLDTTSRLEYVNGPNLLAPTPEQIFFGGGPEYPNIYYSSDSGNTWAERATGLYLYMYSGSSGYAQELAPIHILKTVDTLKSYCCQIKDYAQYEYWSDSLHGLAGLTDTFDDTGTDQTIQGFYGWGTTDGGQNWVFNSTVLPSILAPLDVAPIAGSDLFYFYPNYSIGALYLSNISPYSTFSTADMGATWMMDTFFRGRIKAIVGYGTQLWLALASGDTLTRYHPSEWLAFSSDEKRWDIDSTSAEGLNIIAMDFTDASHGWAIGNDTSTAGFPFTDSTTAYILKYVGPPLAVTPTDSPSPPVLELSPNPAGNSLHFELGAAESIIRCDLVTTLGGTIERPLTALNSSQGDVDISSLAPGMYELRLWTHAGCFSKAFIKAP